MRILSFKAYGKRLLPATVVITLLLASILFSTEDARAGSKSFPKCFIGTFLVDEGSGTKSLWTFGGQGIFFITSSAQEALNFTDEQGAWKKTGQRRAAVVALDFSFDPDGGLANIAKVNTDVTFTGHDCGGIQGEFTVSFYAPDVDLLDPASVPENVVSDTYTGKRVRVE